ncbi:hypothetical protein DSO57_1037333 [Entomophthora muscae]|uniref:Uncharacterized protein n=1 Tax=Entomophthora muscae TaxID=34485 RepID=A0ACC2RQ55_9FUNG|nr:hypothetical protein DSO57_1037333 [Entomophthora muscae]
MLTKQIANKKQYLSGLKIAMLLPVVAESYKLLCASQYLSIYGVPYTEWNILAHIMVDYKMLREACSQEVNKRALAEHKKHKKLAVAQTKAAKEDATLTVCKIVAKQVQKVLFKSKFNKPKSQPKGQSKPKNNDAKPKNPPPKPSNAQAQMKSKNKKPENKNTAKPKYLKGSPPKGSNSTSSWPKTDGKN